MSQILAGLVILALASTVFAQDQAATNEPAFKLTTGFYQYSGAGQQTGQAVDINLRHSSSVGNVWLGHYVSWAHELTQDRAGWDRVYQSEYFRIIPSLQLATGGAWNGSVGLETGESWFAGAGLGRTNLRDSVSLNFDPNDSYSVAGGYRWQDAATLSFLLVRDNRLHPDQQHLHLVYRTKLAEAHRLTIDVLLKSGLVDDEKIERTGLSVTYDWPRWFLRVTFDPKANFTDQDLLRLVTGARF